MSFELNTVKGTAYVFYLNFRMEGNGETETTAEQTFTFSHLIEDSSKFLVSIDRFILPIQSIPMRDAIPNAVILNSKTESDDIILNTPPSFGLYDWLLELSTQVPQFNVTLTADGRAQIFDFNFDNFSITLSDEIASIFSLPNDIDGAGIRSIQGGVPIFDLFDQLYKVQFEALNGLGNLQQEIIDTKVFTTILTDFIITAPFGMSVTNEVNTALNGNITFSMPVRQDITFNVVNRRFIPFRGSSPIQNVKVRAVAIYRDGSRHPIIMPKNSVFEMKLAFFRKN